MGCISSYQDPTQFEIELSKVYALLDELENGELKKDWDSGLDSRVYNLKRDQSVLDEKTAELCSKLQMLSARKLSKVSLEMQMWWRDHQEADKKRLQEQMKTKREQKAKQAALKKLNKYERNLLGL
jgi:hypothetical protein